mgnify:CR=1 FL=1
MANLEEKLDKIERLFSSLGGGVTQREFEDAFKNAVIPFLEKLTDKVNSLEKTYEALLKRIGEEHSGSLSDLKGQVNDVFVGDQIKRIDSESKTSHAGMKQMITEVVGKKLNEMDSMYQEHLKEMEGLKRELEGTAIMKQAEMDTHLKTLEYGKNINIDKKLKDFREEFKKDFQQIKDILANIPRGKGMGRAKVPIVRFIDLSTSVDGSTTTFDLAPDVVAVHGVFSRQFPNIFDTTQWSFAGRTLTLNYTLQTGQSLIVVADVLFYP